MIHKKQNTTKLEAFDRRFLGSTLHEKLKKQGFRRFVVKLGFILPLVFGYVLMGAAWMFMAPNPATPFEKLMFALFWVSIALLGIVSSLLDACENSISPQEGEIYDEWQSQQYIQARSDALPITNGIFVVMTIAGFAILVMGVRGMLPFEYPTYSGIHYYIGLAGACLVAVQLIPGMLLAWRLPDESNDGEGDDDE